MIINSQLLSGFPRIIHGISTRYPDEKPFCNNLSKHAGDSIDTVTKNRRRFFGSLGIDESFLVHANQVHSNGVSIALRPGLLPATDAVVTGQKGLFAVISVADCMPVMIYDPVNSIIANIHSGWRGSQKNISGKTIELMNSNFGSLPASLKIFMGPSISKKNFEVDRDVALLFSSKYSEPKPGAENKFLVDTPQLVYDSLISAGCLPENIERYSECTYDNSHLHSYRRDKDFSGRMFAVIGMI